MKFPKWFCRKHTCTLRAYWRGHIRSTPLEQLCT